MSEAATYHQELQQREKARQDYSQRYYTEMVQFLCGTMDATVEVVRDYHLRITKGARICDFYPRSQKACWLSNPKFIHLTRKHFRIKNVEKFMMEEFSGEDPKRPEGQPAPLPMPTKREVYGDCERGCGGSYVKRKSKTNGSHFLGCSNYPKCKSTKQIFTNQ